MKHTRGSIAIHDVYDFYTGRPVTEFMRKTVNTTEISGSQELHSDPSV